MTAKHDRNRDYYHKDPAYGLNDWEPSVAFVRALLENPKEEGFCWPKAKFYVMRDNSLLSQTFIQHLGKMRDGRAIDIICSKLTQISIENMSIASPWCPAPKYLEAICLESLAMIGGPVAAETIDRYKNDPDKAYLAQDLRDLVIAKNPRPNFAPYPQDFPEILKGVRGYHDVVGGACAEQKYTSSQARQIIGAFRNLKWPGNIEMLSGDGETTTFKLKNKITDHIHNYGDPFCDFGIFLSNPKVEYPLGRRRWAVSHTFLCFPVLDGSLYGKEYVWDTQENTITTLFHEHISLEECFVNADGKSITVGKTPISRGVEVRGNTISSKCNSAVRGVWDNPEKRGKNYYVRRANILTPYRHLYYFSPMHTPIINQLGMWVVHEDEKPERFFDAQGNCLDIYAVAKELLIPLHEPKILATNYSQYEPTGANDPRVESIIEKMRVDLVQVPDASVLDELIGVQFEHSKCGIAGAQQNNDNGYQHGLDLNCNGVIDEEDRSILAKHAGEVYRMNVGDFGYFGINWLSHGTPSRSHGRPYAALYVCCYDYGAGYEFEDGTVHLFDSANPGQKMYVEYHYDAPACPGKDNIKVYLHPDIEPQGNTDN